MEESPQGKPTQNEPINLIDLRRAFRRLAGKMKARTQHFAHRGQKGERPEFWAGAQLATKQDLLELQMLLRRDWRAQ